MSVIRWFILTALFASPSCAHSALEGGIDSASSSAKLYAIERAVRDHDTSLVPDIVRQLDSDDPAVRMIAIDALRRLTGETHGYNYEDAREDREAAVRRWVEQIKDAPHG